MQLFSFGAGETRHAARVWRRGRPEFNTAPGKFLLMRSVRNENTLTEADRLIGRKVLCLLRHGRKISVALMATVGCPESKGYVY
jgi:hypothetical protein